MKRDTDEQDKMYRQAAKLCRAEGVPIDEKPNGAVHKWVERNARCRPGTEFFVVLGICAEMAYLESFDCKCLRCGTATNRSAIDAEGRCHPGDGCNLVAHNQEEGQREP